MKANQTVRNDRAEVGVGTLIVFIAMVLVAAVAAAVLINTTGTLQQRAQATGKEATQEVSSNIKVVNVYGHRNDTTSAYKVHKLVLSLELSAGAVPLDLTKLIVRLSDGSARLNYAYGYANSNGFNTTWVRGTNNSAVMQTGDLVEIELHTWPLTSSEIPTRHAMSLTLIPETGSSVIADFKTPPTYGNDKVITLR
jgi:archaeal flagellin FlaB